MSLTDYLATAAGVLTVLAVLILLGLGLIRMFRRDPADPVFGEGRDDE